MRMLKHPIYMWGGKKIHQEMVLQLRSGLNSPMNGFNGTTVTTERPICKSIAGSNGVFWDSHEVCGSANVDVWFRWPCLFRSIPGDRGRSRVTSPCTSALATYRGTSRIRNRVLIGPYSRTMPKALRWYYGGPGGGLFLMSEVPLYTSRLTAVLPRLVNQANH